MAVKTAPTRLSTLVAAVVAIIGEMNGVIIERETEITLCWTALLAGANMIFFGVPGTAKSMLVNRLADHVPDARYFAVLLMRDMATDAVFGPPDLKQLKLGEYGRNYENYLPTADIGFVDEVGKAPTGILNSMLTIMNEKTFTDKGKRVKVPLMSLFGASNELIGAKELDAIRDRFALKAEVHPLSDSGMRQLLDVEDALPTPIHTITKEDLAYLREQTRQVVVPPAIKDSLIKLRADLRNQGFEPSDRRFKECTRLLKAKALLDGREAVNQDDLDILSHVMWEKPENKQAVTSTVAKLGNPLKVKATEEYDKAFTVFKNADGMSTDASKFTELQTAVFEARTSFKKITDGLVALKDANPGSDHKHIDDTLAKVRQFNARLLEKIES